MENTIQAIDKKSVHQICSGQVVLDLSTAVKELVENALDAGATNIEIKTKEYGKHQIEVIDNGYGIQEKDFQAIALKHYTSKIREFHDLEFVDTFGFRGEALSSLSALSDITVTTKHKQAEVGSKLEFDHNGKLLKNTPLAHSVGTSVIIENIFYTLPVRHKEFHRNFKKDFSKLAHVLYAYSLIHSNIRFTFSNVIGKKKNIMFSTNGKGDIMYIISNIFGSSQAKNITLIEQSILSENVLEDYNLTPKVLNGMDKQFTITGYISKVTHGCGRSSPDRQFFFINKRPCDFTKLTRIVNEAYHGFNRHQYPFILLDISLNKNCVDVNVTPDKRQIMIQQEKILFAIVKYSLKVMFDKCATLFEDHTSDIGLISPSFDQNNVKTLSPNVDSTISDSINRDSATSYQSAPLNHSSSPSNFSATYNASPLEKFRNKYSPFSTKTCPKVKEQKTLNTFFKVSEKKRKLNDIQDDNDYSDEDTQRKKSCQQQEENICTETPIASTFSTPKCSLKTSDNYNTDDNFPQDPLVVREVKEISNNDLCEGNEEYTNNNTEDLQNDLECSKECENKELNTKENTKDQYISSPSEYSERFFRKPSECSEEDVKFVACNENTKRPCVVVQFDMDSITSHFQQYNTISKQNQNQNINVSSFRAKISPSDNKNAENELDKHVSKDMFQNMEIIGQFNLGFIIAKLKNDLFIIDQHATDEKYNFETLQEKHCLKSQKLIQPIPLELTLINKSILLDNMEIFHKNGFDFDIIDTDNLHDSDVKLIKVPTSRNWTFASSDVEELIFMLTDSPNTMCRPSRVRLMFASRACRTSIMVGTALSKQQMKMLVTHMGEIEHPWNCPHGRPTMRHLINLLRISF